VKRVGAEPRITGLLPLYRTDAGPSDLLRHYEAARKKLTAADEFSGISHIRFANADTTSSSSSSVSLVLW
jgi:hypothetical protein